MNHQLIEVNKLERSPLNARRTPGAALEGLQSSILAHGLMQNLVVTAGEADSYRVIAGGRRLEAIRALQREGKLPADYAVACQVVEDSHALELSLAENAVRQAMHPADEFEAFARLIEAGERIERIAARFGVTAKHVEQRLMLGRLAPELLEAYRAETLTLECLMAFTITDDRSKQLQVYRSLQPWQVRNAREIRALLTGEMAEAASKLARFVGLDAYHAAGGVSRADLFSDRVYLENPELLNRLAAEKLDAARQALETEGWGWIEVSVDRDWSFIHACGRIYPQPVDVPADVLARKAQIEDELEAIERALEDTESDALIDAQDEAEARLAAIDAEIASFTVFDPEQMALAGCYVSIGHDGALSVEKGLVRREDAKRLATGAGDQQAKPNGISASLHRDLEAYRLQVAQVEIARNPLIALDLLAFKAARQALGMRTAHSGPDVQFTRHVFAPAAQEEPTAASSAFEAIAERLPRAWLHQESEAEQFQAFIALSDKEKLGFLAYGIATSLKPQLSTGHESTAYELALSLTDADPARYWRPTQANYLGRVTRDQLLALGRTLFGEPWAQARRRDKKSELARTLERAFAEPERYARTPQQLEMLRRWLPDGMAFGAAEAPFEGSMQEAA